jgi:hypothetical protein
MMGNLRAPIRFDQPSSEPPPANPVTVVERVTGARGLGLVPNLSFRRTPGPLCSSAGMNSTPAFSSAVWSFHRVSAAPRISEAASSRLIVVALTDANFESWAWLTSNKALAALICAASIIFQAIDYSGLCWYILGQHRSK